MAKKLNAEAVETTVEETNAEAVTTEKVKTRKIELFKDGKDYKDDVFVCINGRNMVIKRGVEVEVPEAFAKVLDQSKKQDTMTARLMEEQQNKFREQSNK